MTVGIHARRARTHVTGAASTAIRAVLDGPRRPARVLAAFPAGVYLEVRTDLEPSVIAMITGAATRLPNSVLLAAPLPHVTVGDDASVGDGTVELGRLSLRARRWWDPAPPLGPIDRSVLAGGASRLDGGPPGLAGNPAVELLAASCASGWLLGAVTAAERLVGLGPGLTPSGDDVLAGLLVTLRHLGSATATGRAVWLADWLAATVTFDARTRTTPISATLLHCAARGEASPEVIAVLRGLAGRQPLEPAVRRLHALGHTSGADLAQGVAIGLMAVLALGGPQ
ncbi:DUF2877 domain-containing protein [Nonomuraea sp. NN258]|uniref:DUF2877 domain-containing protein n=1 Tax=Nonomuraea antri TaxID=2730852 RepID=UPI00156A3C08|nr:DUF2877 domain-containing protein [Nonomuraea antri]NRQ30553.1 DUF2877 domain-containing protein [Nonomuraea antri]